MEALCYVTSFVAHLLHPPWVRIFFRSLCLRTTVTYVLPSEEEITFHNLTKELAKLLLYIGSVPLSLVLWKADGLLILSEVNDKYFMHLFFSRFHFSSLCYSSQI